MFIFVPKLSKHVKIIGAYLLLFTYLAFLVRPILPFIDYNINYDYIAKVLCINKDVPESNCNGKCQLTKELKKTLPSDLDDKAPGVPVVDTDKFPVFRIPSHTYKLTLFYFQVKKITARPKTDLSAGFLLSIFHPPESY